MWADFQLKWTTFNFWPKFGEIAQLRAIFWFKYCWGCCRELGGGGWSWVEVEMSWVEVDGAGWSWVEVDGAGWRWVYGLVIPIVLMYWNVQIFECLNRMLKCSNTLMLRNWPNTGVCSSACFFSILWCCSFLKCWWQENKNTPTKHFVKNAKHLNIWRKEKATKMWRLHIMYLITLYRPGLRTKKNF